MDLVSALVILILALLSAVVISRPFSGRSPGTAVSPQDLAVRRSALLAEKERLLRSLQELDFDYTLGKIPADDYPVQRRDLLARSAEVLKTLDEVEARLETERSAARTAVEEGDLEALIANRRRQRQERSAGFCPSCGHALQRSDKFCPQCGHALKQDE